MFNVTIAIAQSGTPVQLASAFQETGPGGWRLDFTETGTMSCVLYQNTNPPGTVLSASNLTAVAYYDSNGAAVNAGTALTATGWVTVDAVNQDLYVIATLTGLTSTAYITRQISPTTGNEPGEGNLPANNPAFTGTLTGPAVTLTGAMTSATVHATGAVTMDTTALVTGVATFTAAPVFSAGTASQTVELTAGKALTTAAITGTGNYVKSASPTLTGTALLAAATLSGLTTLTGGMVVATLPTVDAAAGGMWQTATNGTDSACTDGTSYFVELNIRYNRTITGLAYQVGSVGGTDSVIVVLYNSAGAVVANSALAGAVVGTAAQIQSVDFLTPYAAVAGRYFASVTFNGATAKFRTYAIPGSKFIAGSEAETFGTVTAITPGTSFTADKGPLCFAY